jgi:hypothetical protein
MLKMLFLRIYAANLRRSWRSDPDSAWWDAVTTLMFLIGLPLLTLMFDLWVLALDLFPKAIGAVGMPESAGFAVVLASGIALLVLITKTMRVYREGLGKRDRYDSATDRWKIVAAIAFAIGLIVVMNVVTSILHAALHAH